MVPRAQASGTPKGARQASGSCIHEQELEDREVGSRGQEGLREHRHEPGCVWARLRGGDRGTTPCTPLPREAVPLDGVEASVWSYLVSSMILRHTRSPASSQIFTVTSHSHLEVGLFNLWLGVRGAYFLRSVSKRNKSKNKLMGPN